MGYMHVWFYACASLFVEYGVWWTCSVVDTTSTMTFSCFVCNTFFLSQILIYKHRRAKIFVEIFFFLELLRKKYKCQTSIVINIILGN